MISIDDTIYSVYVGTNSGLIKNVASLYFNQGDRIADVTYGKGVFWKKVDTKKYDIVGSDLLTGIDFRNLPYQDNEFSHSVIDPPYARKDLKGMVNCYQTTKSATHKEIIKLYEDGLKECARITKGSGYILCKCQDEIYGCKQRWSHIEIKEIAEQLGLYAKDLFILVNQKKPRPVVRQLHARKLHSYLWVFQVKK
jgi:tRNA G10  N-methylase Trm11